MIYSIKAGAVIASSVILSVYHSVTRPVYEHDNLTNAVKERRPKMVGIGLLEVIRCCVNSEPDVDL